MRHIALFISIFFHPVFLFFYTYNFFLYGRYTFLPVREELAFEVNLMIFLNTILFPVTFTYWVNKDLFLRQRSSRLMPFLGTFVFYAVTYYLIRYVPFPPVLGRLLLAISIGIGALAVFSLRWKFSTHTLGAGSLVAFFAILYARQFPDFVWPFFGVIIIAGLIGSSRLYLGAHDPAEVYGGYILGTGITAATVLFPW